MQGKEIAQGMHLRDGIVSVKHVGMSTVSEILLIWFHPISSIGTKLVLDMIDHVICILALIDAEKGLLNIGKTSTSHAGLCSMAHSRRSDNPIVELFEPARAL